MEKVNFNDAINCAHRMEFAVRKKIHGNLDEYCAVPFIQFQLLKLVDDYFEYPMGKDRLGVTLVDDVTTVTISKNIENQPRKYFTQAHELCHVLLDQEYLRLNPNMDTVQSDGLPTGKNPRDIRANRFAAMVLLPDQVLNTIMLEHLSRKKIKSVQKISYETLSYRLIDFLRRRLYLPKGLSKGMVDEFMHAKPGSGRETSLAKFWDTYLVSQPYGDARPLSVINEEKALSFYDPQVLMDRRRKKKLQQIKDLNSREPLYQIGGKVYTETEVLIYSQYKHGDWVTEDTDVNNNW